ncbi:MAG: TonB-dependent receptor [Candidatus Pseudobacter hemicellulosilyticus]|uniref:TonB-dependent receptor n=1 Tax=Candidatus Pseudobacter hemicellulosilyticus TaxID=3121375 RepID=A0AAJ5WVJ9_9BACT|nr:MAG: TonB-dependent receptor [Pseudobacter sp.]
MLLQWLKQPRRQFFVLPCLIFLLLLPPAVSLAQEARYTVKFEQENLEQALDKLRTLTRSSIAFNKEEVKAIAIKPATYTDKTVEQILRGLLASLPFSIEKRGAAWLVKKAAEKQDQSAPVKKDPGKVTGRIIDEENGQPVAGATIWIGNKGTTTGIDGSFMITLPKGNYTAIISFVGYGTKEISDVEAKDNQNFELNATLKREKGQLAAVVVKSSAKKETVASLYTRQKNNAGITDGISAEQIERTPDKNIAETLKRISGLTNLDNKYVVVRGLSERYNQAMMNGQMMPSTELNRKNFSYDIIPSSMVDNVIVTKTLTPDLSAEFGGGLVQINTRDIPANDFLSITVGTSVNEKTTGKTFRSPVIGKSEYFGSIPGDRKLFGTVDWKSQSAIVNSGNFNAGTLDDKLLKDASLFANNWGLENYTPAPAYNGQLSLGKVVHLPKEQSLGLMLSASYRNTWQTQDIRMSRDGYIPSDVDLTNGQTGFSGKRYGFESNLGGTAGLGYQNKRNKLSLQSIYLRTLDQQFVLGTGVQQDHGQNAGYYDMLTATRLWQNQLKTEHLIGNKGVKLNLSVNYTVLDRLKPDNKQANMGYVGSKTDGPDVASADFSIASTYSGGVSAGALRWWSRALEKNWGWNADLSVPFRFTVGALPVTNMLKTGYAGWNKDRLFWVLITGAKGFVDGTNPEPLSKAFDPAGGGEIYASKFGDDFHRKPTLHAGYLMMDNKIANKLRLVYGVRGEYYNLNGFNALLESFVANQQQNNGDLTDYSDLYNREPDWNFFPSANLTYSLTPKMNLRFAYSKSIIRPDLREIAWFREYDFELGGSYWSQSPLISTKIHHLDFRYEWYPAPGEVLSFSLFYKKLLYPMEIFAMQNKLFELRNDKDAINKGIEVELRKSLAFTNVPVLKNITLYGNFTRLFSTVRLMGVSYSAQDANTPHKLYVTEIVGNEEKRPQSGASNFMYNAGLYYDQKLFSLSLSYNQVGNRFYRVGTNEVGSLYEQPMQSLDAQLAVRLLKEKATVKLNVGNLLNSKYLIYVNRYKGSIIPSDGHTPTAKELLYQKGTDMLDYEGAPGRTYSLSFSYNF